MDFKECEEQLNDAMDQWILEKEEVNRLLEGFIFANQKI